MPVISEGLSTGRRISPRGAAARVLILLLFAISSGSRAAPAQAPPIDVQVVGDFNSYTTTVGGTLFAALSATVTNAPAVDEQSLDVWPQWTWTAEVSAVAEDGTTSPAPAGDYTATWYFADDGSPDAFLDVEFNAAGTYQVHVEAVVQYPNVTGDSGLVLVPGQ